MTPLQAVKTFCRECMGNSPKLVTECPSYNCSLYPFRFGTNPRRKGIGNKDASVKKTRS